MRRLAALVALALAGASCAADDGPMMGGAGDGPPGDELVAVVASFDVAADVPQRFLLGLMTGDNRIVTGGIVALRFFFLGEERAEGQPELTAEEEATFLPLPGETGPFPDQAAPRPASRGRGVYRVERIEFDRPGIWEVEVAADLEGLGERTATAAFQVLPEPLVPMPGERAPRTENLTLDSEDAPEAAVDSRAETGGIPDPELHRTTIAEAIRAGRPAVVVFATPVYCESRFCGPVTDMVAELAGRYGDRAEFIHVEIWRDFQDQVLNRAAADWLLREGNLQEPWVFLIGADGRIEARWDNVATPQEIEPLLERLPAGG